MKNVKLYYLVRLSELSVLRKVLTIKQLSANALSISKKY
jgi:hypothetical protein